MEDGFISIEEYEIVLSKETSREKRRCMLLLFDYKSEQAFEAFTKALIETSNAHVAEEFRRVENEICKQDEAKHGGQSKSSTRKVRSKSNAKASSSKRKHLGNKDAKREEDESSSSDSEEETESDSESEDEEDNDEVDELVDLFYAIKQRVKRMNFYPDEEYFVNKFQTPIKHLVQENEENLLQVNNHDENQPILKSVNTGLRYGLPFWIKTQHFRVNRPIFLSKVGFFGPATAEITSYRIRVHLIKREPRDAKFLQLAVDDKIGIIAASFQAVEVQHGQILYIPFKFPIGIEPNTWYKIKFKISGMGKILTQSKESKLPEAIVDSKRHGNVKFEFGTRFINSACQIPILGFFKGKSRLTVSSFPSTCEELVLFEDQQDVIDWEDKDKLTKEAGHLFRTDN